jgi:hypothetical protein
MKTGILLLLLFAGMFAHAQDEFASTTFYNAIKKVRADSQTGFEQLKGNILQTPFADIRKEYRVKFMLPLADSGKIVIPAAGSPFAVYFFEAEKKKENINERAVSLREAIVASHGEPLYTRTISTTVKEEIHSDTYFYTDPEETHTSKALFRTTIYKQKKRYHLSFEIRGN